MRTERPAAARFRVLVAKIPASVCADTIWDVENACTNARAGGTVSPFDADLLIVGVAEVGGGARTASATGMAPTAAGIVQTPMAPVKRLPRTIT